jgi:hypothetical protein
LGIPTADTTTPLSDDNASNSTRTRHKSTSTPAPDAEGARPAAADRRPATQSVSATRPPGPGVLLPPKPVWAPEPMVTPKWAVLPEPVDEAVPPPIPNWEYASAPVSWLDAPYEQAISTTRPPRPVHPVEETHQHHSRGGPAVTTAAVLASLFVVFVVVLVVMVLLHHSANPPAGKAASTTAVVAPDTARLQTATTTMDTNANTTRLALHLLDGIPTTATVAAVINPYVSTLQHYQTVLSGAKVPAAARGTAARVDALVSGDVRSLATIDGLPPLRLGSYLVKFDAGATQLQKDLHTLEHALGARTG